MEIITASPSSSAANTPPHQPSASGQTSLPLDYSLGNFKPAIAADFPVFPSSQSSLQLRDIGMLTTMAATIPSPTQLLQQRSSQSNTNTAAASAGSQSEQRSEYIQPISAFKAVLPKKKTSDGKSENF